MTGRRWVLLMLLAAGGCGGSAIDTDGAVFYAEHPSKITGYDGPPPTPAGLNITRITVTAPFQILEAPEAAQSGQLTVTGPPRTSLPVSVD